jgi:general secretion pathway protein L
MAHNSIGLDLGSSEVRAVVTRVSLRKREIVQLEREKVKLDETGASSPKEVLAAAGRLMKRIDATEAGLHCALTGELVSIRKIVLPAGAAKKLDQVLTFELDEVLPFPIEDAVFDYVETHRTAQDIVVLTASVLHEKVENLIVGLEAENISPREIGVDTFSYLNRIAVGDGTDEVVAFVDIGHFRTNIAVLDKTEPTVRTVLRGARQLTAKLAETGGVDFEKAEMYKREFGLTGKVGDVLQESLRPLIREIQQTFKGHLTAGGRPVSRMKLCGGGALLIGLDRHLSDALNIPVEIFEVPTLGALKNPDDLKNTSFALAYMIALREEVPHAKRINVRRGTLAFKGDYQALRARAKWMGLGVVIVLLCWAFSGYALYAGTEKQVESRRQELSSRTKNVFGQVILEKDKIAEKLKGGAKDEKAPVPRMDAFDLIIELSKRIPESIVHDVEQIEIKQKRVTLKGLIDPELKSASSDTDPLASPPSGSLQAVPEDEFADPLQDTGEISAENSAESALSPSDLLKQKLEEFKECFTTVRMGRVSTVGDKRRYQMDIDSRCP